MDLKILELATYKVNLYQGHRLLLDGERVILHASVFVKGRVQDDGSPGQIALYFVDPAGPVPDAQLSWAEARAKLFLPMGQLAAHVDILRNEKPLYALMIEGSPHATRITSDPEPIGEGE